jgi:hypothetical protein
MRGFPLDLGQSIPGQKVIEPADGLENSRSGSIG